MKNKLNKLLGNAHCHYSKLQVSAVAITNDGKEFCGVNVENASFGATNCAERSAMFAAISAGYKPGEINEIHLTSSIKDHALYPCGICLQVMSELMSSNAVINIYFNEQIIIKQLKDLFPNNVSRADIGWK